MIEPVTAAVPAADSSAPRPRNVKEAAAQFEALLISQLLKSAHADGESWLGTGDDQAGASMTELAEEHLAQSLAASGGLGLAKLVVRGLASAK
jgi:Rod binding domain-containing protein